ncbi:zinc finger protein 335-like [Syngnathus typhle]|uniref:zinc finger protein 335-like n=1 Tax=Syngnathus typhle TaxID=161592 RepID=UPI002A6A3983|nr:zinc finger protein 335-like [Syngnathus typhle]XP_061157586.1 zinc finger protein 335-like [Syngnathus typhle]XP_061157597.1 zinc finger protein 335-like [Syngnathus typhle]XP_061157604.1 zinc finger protein 335-like [Syngnathus typhle]XP_061157613.1 zinc finger protein 335-like [Syngnathus typhle]XP_061157621.1 zinc finger protein 335-like [Syngnathus typhle]
MDSEENEVESSSDAGPAGMEEPSESGMGMESSEAMSADSSDAASSHAQPPESDCHVGQSSEGLVVFIPETSSSTDVRVSSVHLPDSSSVAQSTSVSSVSTVTQSVLVSESAQVLVHSSAAASEGAMMVSDSTASTSSDLGSAIDKIIESTIGPDILNGCIAVTSAEDRDAEPTQYLILQGAPMVAHMSSSVLSGRIATEALSEGPTSTCLDQGDMQRSPEPDQPDDQPGHSGYPEDSSSHPDQPQHSHPSQYLDCGADGPDQTGESSPSYAECSEEPDQTRSQSGFPDYSGDNSDQDLPGYVECSRADSNPTSRGNYVVECSARYLCAVDDGERPHHSRAYIDSSADHRTQMSRQYTAAADSEQPECSRYRTRDDDDDDDERTQDPDQPQQQPQHSCYTENSNGPDASLYTEDSSSSDHPVADTADSGGVPEVAECSQSQLSLYISSSGTYTANYKSDVAPQCSASRDDPRQVEAALGQRANATAVAEGSGDRPPNLAELEEMMEVVIVQQYKCKMCPYKSVSKDTLINHMREKHFKPSGGLQTKRKRGRPPKSATAASQQADQGKKEEVAAERRAMQPKVSASHQAQEDDDQEDQIPDAGAIDDSEEDSNYNPAEEDCHGRLPAILKKHTPPISSSSQGRPQRKVGRPRKYNILEEDDNSQEAESLAKKPRVDSDSNTADQASSSGLDNDDGALAADRDEEVEVVVSQSDSENKDPSSNSQQEEFFQRKRGRPSKCFLRKKYKKHLSRNRYYKSLKPLLRPHSCWICGSRFLTQEDLRFHVDSHEGNEPERFKCLQCNYRCKRWSSLKEHMFNHEGTKPFKCEKCEYSSVYRKDVIRHAAIHDKEKKKKTDVTLVTVTEFPCPMCHKVYPMQKRLTQHMKTHSAEKPHMCDKCGKSFKKRYTFKMHLLTHLQSVGNSTFKCEFCDYTCANKKLLLNHQLSHTSDRPYKCEHCKYTTSKEDFLVSHLAIKHTGDKPFACTMCHFGTKHRKNLRLHVQCRHPEAFEEWSIAHPATETKPRRKPFYALQHVEEQKEQDEEAAQVVPNGIVSVDPAALEAIQGMGNASVSQDALGNTTIIYEHAESGELSAQNALSLLLNMSNARELVGDALQVTVLKADGSTDVKALEKETWSAISAASGQAHKVVTVHVSENGDTVLQEAYEAETEEIAQIGMETYTDEGEFNVVEQVTEEVQSSECSNENTDQVQESEEQSLKSDKFYLASGLPDGVLQVELSSEAPSSPSATTSPCVSGKRFSCRICTESFHCRSDMENHKRAHVDTNTFRCHDCDFTSSSWPEVKAHMELHSYLRPHKCLNCSFASKNRKDLRRHLLTHTNEKPFSCNLCGQSFNRNGHLKFHKERVHNQKQTTTRKSRGAASQQTIVVNGDEEALATLQSLHAHQAVISTDQLQALGQEHIIVAQDQSLTDQEETTYIQQITTIDGQTVQHLMTGDNQVTEVQYIISQDGVQHLIPQEYVVLAEGNHIQIPDGQIIQYEHEEGFLQEQQMEVSSDNPIQYLPAAASEQQALESAAHSAVTAVADAPVIAEAQVQEVYTTEATPEQMAQLQQEQEQQQQQQQPQQQQQGVRYDIIAFTVE